MIRKLNRVIHDYLREKRLKIGRFLYDRKEKQVIIDSDDFLKDNKIKSILFLRYDGKIGDMVVNTFMFREIKKRFPDIKIGVVVRKENRDIISSNSNVDEIYLYDKKNIRFLATEIKKEKYDLLIDFSEMLRVKQMQFIKECDCCINMGLNRKDWNLFDISVEAGKDFQWDEHITKRYLAYLKKMSITKDIDTSYDISVKKIDKDISFFNKNKSEYKVILNPFGASKHKNFTEKTLKAIINILNKYELKIILLYYGDKKTEVNKLKDLRNVYIPESITSIEDSIFLISKSDLVITPDTSIVHIATALKKDTIAVYPPHGGTYGVDHLVWAPKGNNYEVLFCKDKSGEYDEVNLNTFEIKDMENAIAKELENRIWKN